MEKIFKLKNLDSGLFHLGSTKVFKECCSGSVNLQFNLKNRCINKCPNCKTEIEK